MNKTDFHLLKEKINLAKKNVKLAENLLNHKPIQIEGESSHILAWRNLNKSVDDIKMYENLIKQHKTNTYFSRKRKRLSNTI